MNTTKRIMAMLLAISCTMPLLACGKDDEDSSSSFVANSIDEEERNAISDIANQEGIDDMLTYTTLENKTVKWMANWDINPDETGKAESVELTLFQEKYDGVVEYYAVDWSTRYDSLATAIVGGEGIDFFPAGDMDAFPKGAIKGMFVPVDDYVDFSTELWEDVEDANDALLWNGNHYIICTEVTGDNCAVIYNKQTVADAGFTDPAELLEKGEWTWDVFYEMMENFADPENGTYGIDGYWTEKGLSLTTGVPYIGLEDGVLVNNLKDSSIERVNTLMYDMYTNNLILNRADFNWEIQTQFIGEGKTLFYPCGLWTLYREKPQWVGDFGEDVFFVPMPRDPEADEYYIPAGLDGYVMCKNGSNPEGVIAFAECKRLALMDETAQEIGSNKLKNEYGWTDEMIEMKATMQEIAQENPVFDFFACVTADLTTVLDSEQTGIRASLSGGILWSETMNNCYDFVDTVINETNENPLQASDSFN